jgi:nicotinamide-nucleotide amidase
MSIEVVSIGNEVLRGIIVNTNAAFLSRRLTEEGWEIACQTTLPDENALLIPGLNEALIRNSVVIATGGLGATLDDNTLVCAKELFSKSPHELPNSVGAAPGYLFSENKKLLFLLPGVPSEMEQMFEEAVVPYLKKHMPGVVLHREELHFYLLKEDDVDPLLRDLQKEHKLDIGIYPSYNGLSVVLRGRNKEHVIHAKKTIAEAFKASLLPAAKLEEAIHDWMVKHHQTLALAESCTGGFMASQLTNIPGASEYFLGSIVTYANSLKEGLLGVSSETLQKHGAVSREVVHEMWMGLMKKTGADYGIAVSGIAGPQGGTPDKPVGTVFYALGKKGQTPEINTLHVKGNRQTVILRTTKKLFGFLLKKIL